MHVYPRQCIHASDLCACTNETEGERNIHLGAIDPKNYIYSRECLIMSVCE